MTDGTGVVHIAPAFGEDDSKVGRKYDLPFLQMVDENGMMTKETKWAGHSCIKRVDLEGENGVSPEVIKDLKAVSYTHLLKEGQAESWETSEDGLTWTFHLRDGLKWSDGTDLTAEDFVYSWQRVCDPNVAAPYAETVLGMVKGYDEAVAGDITKLDVQAPEMCIRDRA